MTKIATWNVNSIRARLPNVEAWVREAQPDVLLLQETKTIEETFPKTTFEDLGYNMAIVGQKSYNGVAILSKSPIEDIRSELPGDPLDVEARYIEVVTGNVRVASVYVPNGQEVGSQKFEYKLRFLDRLYDHMKTLLTYDESLVVGGDYNIAPTDDDVHDPVGWEGKILCSDHERAAFRKILYLGLTDALKEFHVSSGIPKDQLYSWWNYKGRRWDQNEGLRIDHLLVSPQAADRLKDVQVDRLPRGEEKASDHTPVWCSLGE
ncbi:MAG: exodeoxyribonuclease III [Alphaproteobacteria bacterium]|jgi:exodeoxyribonuclease III|nr:exodeoxyribonuclease III [Alphaproteobacteria bacterium]MBT5389366.1 exodeoxyribonuclease III [Alphaproteobacteria bacterium]MBT5540560.1 exodeoxyribonuclease III [Alphaproteobacteria bacterium]